MSVLTWKMQFLRDPAPDVTIDNALDHSIKKWTGVLKVNLAKHYLGRHRRVIMKPADLKDRYEEVAYANTPPSGSIVLTTKTCALCTHYYMDQSTVISNAFEGALAENSPNSSVADCPNCPIVLAGNAPCNVTNSLYDRAIGGGDREVKALIAVMQYAKAKKIG